MCGIAGWIGRVDERSGAAANRARLARMTASIAHRGPDGEGTFVARTRDAEHEVALGHRRLAIIDLAGGVQPMRDEAAGLTLTYNGEVYNFRELRAELAREGALFRTSSDTEVVLRAYERWGDACVERFRGMFAFAIWDERRERLVLARDPFGKKPLYLAEPPGRLIFASEAKAILATGWVAPEIDLEAAGRYLTFRYVPAPLTLHRSIRKLMPGSIAVWERGRLAERRYWTAPDGRPRDPSALAAGDVAAAFRAKLAEAVRIRMVSDVPYGAFLSGGIDSASVVALMTRHSGRVKTFSVGFAEEEYSELSPARLVAERFATDHAELVVSQDHLMRELPALVRFRDAPVSEPSDIPIYLLSREAAKSVKMVLTGEGSDEILGGYPKHVFERLAGAYQLLPDVVRRGLIEPLVAALPFSYRRAKTAVLNLGLRSPEERLPRWFGCLSDRERAALVAHPALARARHQGVPFDADPRTSALRRILYYDQTSWLPDNLLERGDRMTMAASIEARMPFLDKELAALASALPDRLRVRGLRTKWILREAMKDLLPAGTLARRKVGFRVPFDAWVRGPMRAYVAEHLLGPDARTRVLYRRPALESVIAEHVGGRRNHEKLLWTLLSLEVWSRECLGATPRPASAGESLRAA